MKFIELIWFQLFIVKQFNVKNCLFKNYPEELVYSDTTKCQNYDRSHLDKMYSHYLEQYRADEEVQFQKFRSDTNFDNQDHQFDKNLFFENSECNEHKRNRTQMNQQSLCPWRFKILYRKDKYPYYTSIVKCTCETCSSKSSYFFECIPVFKKVPVLERTFCRSDGFFEWKKSFERISVACVCAFRHKFFPHRI